MGAFEDLPKWLQLALVGIAFLVCSIDALLILLLAFKAPSYFHSVQASLSPFYFRTTVALLIATGTVLWARRAIIIRTGGALGTGNVIAFDAACFLVLGIAVAVSASDRWPIACLWAGAGLFVGGFIGFLFGVPYTATASAAKQGGMSAVNNQSAQGASSSNPSAQAAAAVQSEQTLLVEAASWLSKFLAGATFARAHYLRVQFMLASEYISASILVPAPADHRQLVAIGAGFLLYFCALGFLAGLLLPRYFFQEFFRPLN